MNHAKFNINILTIRNYLDKRGQGSIETTETEQPIYSLTEEEKMLENDSL